MEGNSGRPFGANILGNARPRVTPSLVETRLGTPWATTSGPFRAKRCSNVNATGVRPIFLIHPEWGFSAESKPKALHLGKGKKVAAEGLDNQSKCASDLQMQKSSLRSGNLFVYKKQRVFQRPRNCQHIKLALIKYADGE